MNWYQEWQALSARIHGLLDVGSFFYSALQNYSSDDMSVRKKILLANAKKIFESLNNYLEEYQATFPKEAFESIKRFLEQPDIKNFNFTPDSGKGEQVILGWKLLVQLILNPLPAFMILAMGTTPVAA
jgi:hypothetical protein